MKLSQYHNIYLIGIGGIGMSALARWFHRLGCDVAGYDRVRTTLTNDLEGEGIAIHYDDRLEEIPAAMREQQEQTLIIFTPAVPADHKELNFFRSAGFVVMKRSEVLGLITQGFMTVAVAGTHGKTTTSSMIAHILKYSGRNMVAFLGGIATNYHSNLIVEGEAESKMIVVAEADEFDRSFLRLHPDVAVVTSADPDHLDIYGDKGRLQDAFREFVSQIRPGGALIVHHSIAELFSDIANKVKVFTYGVNRGQFFAGNVEAQSGFFAFDLSGFGLIERITLVVPGFHNVENAVAAALAAHCCGLEMSDIASALAKFEGVKRRFEFIIRDGVVYIDDYAHHPAEIEAFLNSLRAMYPDRKLTVVFQPHLYSRTRDFAAGFASSLSMADELLLMDIYPARELPIPGVDSGIIFDQVKAPFKMRCDKENLLEKIGGMDVEVLATVGAGDIDTFVEPIKNMLIRKYAA